MLTSKQEKYCRFVALYGYSPDEAVRAAGYASANGSVVHVVSRLTNDINILSRIDQIRDDLFDPDSVREDLIRLDRQATYFNVTDYVQVVEEYKDDGTPYMRKKLVKPMVEWDSFALQNVCGYDKTGMPIFRDKEDASKELKKMYGLYKENTVTVEQDTNNVLAMAGLTPSTSTPSGRDNPNVPQSIDSFDGARLDNSIRMETKDIEKQESRNMHNTTMQEIINNNFKG